jgi:hypothetical protein
LRLAPCLSLIIALGIVLGGCSSDDDEGPPSGYSAELRDDFVSDCTGAGTAEAVCGCLYDRLEAEVPFERFEQLDEQLRSGEAGEAPMDVEAMAVACAADPDSADG